MVNLRKPALSAVVFGGAILVASPVGLTVAASVGLVGIGVGAVTMLVARSTALSFDPQ